MIIGYISLFPFIFHPISYRYFLFKDKSVHNEIYAHMALADERCFARCFCRDFRNIAMRYFRNHKKRPSTIRRLRPVNGLIFGIRFLCSVRQTGSCRCEGYAHFALLLFRTPSFILFTLRFHTKY